MPVICVFVSLTGLGRAPLRAFFLCGRGRVARFWDTVAVRPSIASHQCYVRINCSLVILTVVQSANHICLLWYPLLGPESSKLC